METVQQIAISPNSCHTIIAKRVATDEQRSLIIELWNLTTDVCHRQSVDTIYAWAVLTNGMQYRQPVDFIGVYWAPDSLSVAISYTFFIEVYKIEDDQMKRVVKINTAFEKGSKVDFSPNGLHVTLSPYALDTIMHSDNFVVMDLRDGALERYEITDFRFRSKITFAKWSPCGKYIATGVSCITEFELHIWKTDCTHIANVELCSSYIAPEKICYYPAAKKTHNVPAQVCKFPEQVKTRKHETSDWLNFWSFEDVLWSKDASQIVLAEKHMVYVYAKQTNSIIRTINVKEVGVTKSVLGVTWDGDNVVMLLQYDMLTQTSRAVAFKHETKEEIQSYQSVPRGSHRCFSRDGLFLVQKTFPQVVQKLQVQEWTDRTNWAFALHVRQCVLHIVCLFNLTEMRSTETLIGLCRAIIKSKNITSSF